MQYIYDSSLLYYHFVETHMCVCILSSDEKSRIKEKKSRKVDKKKTLFCFIFVFLAFSFPYKLVLSRKKIKKMILVYMFLHL